MSELSDSIQALPNQSWIPILVLLVLGIALWLAGGRLLKGAFAAMGLVAGGSIGWIVGSAIDFGVSVWVIALIMALLVACVATLAYRATVAMALAAVLALASPLGVWTAAGAELAPGPETTTVAASDNENLGPVLGKDEPELDLDEIDSWLRDLADDAKNVVNNGPMAAPEATFDLQQEVRDQLENARTLGDELARQARELWDRTPSDLRTRLIGAAAVGALIGFLLGTLATTFSTLFVTAFAGSLTMIVGGWSAATKVGVPDGPWVPDTPNAWLTWWVIIAVIGLVIQWMTRPKRADKAA
jgi:ElaB/YqjD/DUF883 family membrane-anchored ribosome-binding protein